MFSSSSSSSRAGRISLILFGLTAVLGGTVGLVSLVVPHWIWKNANNNNNECFAGAVVVKDSKQVPYDLDENYNALSTTLIRMVGLFQALFYTTTVLVGHSTKICILVLGAAALQSWLLASYLSTSSSTSDSTNNANDSSKSDTNDDCLEAWWRILLLMVSVLAGLATLASSIHDYTTSLNQLSSLSSGSSKNDKATMGETTPLRSATTAPPSSV